MNKQTSKTIADRMILKALRKTLSVLRRHMLLLHSADLSEGPFWLEALDYAERLGKTHPDLDETEGA